MLDLVIRNGDVVDGSGSPRRRADVAIADGRVVDVGHAAGDAVRVIDATDRIVAPGFVDVHTHVDAQVFWDPLLTPSSLHGVTTVIGGNCGFTLSPLDDDSADYLLRMLAVVEGMPLAALQAGVPCDWRSTREYLDRLEGALAINAGFSVGHSALRRVVLGPGATRRAGDAGDVDAMVALLRAGLEAGALGFSSSWGPAHMDAVGDPVPSRFATIDELVALARVCGEFDGTSIEFIPKRVDVFGDEEREVLRSMSAAAGRTLNWNVMRFDAATVGQARVLLEGWGSDSSVAALTMPIPSRARFSFATGFVLEMLTGWRELFALPLDERRRVLADPAARSRLATSAASGGFLELADWGNRVVTEVFEPHLKSSVGRRVDDIAAERGVEPFDALVDMVCADDLRLTFSRPPTPPSAADWAAAVELWREPGVVIGGSDAGAHLDFTAYFDYPVYILEHAVREHRALTLEEAVHHLTEVPATLYGLRARGRVAPGHWADLVIFDEATVASGPMETRFDLPAGAGRLYGEPVGIDAVLVNGTTIVEDGAATGSLPGRLLRSGRDTTTR